MNCRPMCKMYSMKSIKVRLHPSLFKAMSIPKSCSEFKKCLSPEFVKILSTAERSLPSGWVMTSHEIEGSKLFISLIHTNSKKKDVPGESI